MGEASNSRFFVVDKYESAPDLQLVVPRNGPFFSHKHASKPRRASTTSMYNKEYHRLYQELPYLALVGMPRKSIQQRRSRYQVVRARPLREEVPSELGAGQVYTIEDDEDEDDGGGAFTAQLAIASVLAMQGTFQIGYNSAVVNGCDGVVFPGHSDLEWSVVVSIFCIGGLVGALAAGHLADKLGRRGALLQAAVAFVFAAAIMFFAPNVYVLMVGRLVVGLGAGAGSVLVPMYVGEVAPPQLRGVLGALSQLHLVTGILTANCLAIPLATETGWRWLFVLTAAPALAQLLLCAWLPESPRLLLMHGRRDAAAAALSVLRATDDVAEEIDAIVDASKREAAADGGGGGGGGGGGLLAALRRDPKVAYALTVGCGLHLAQQLSGVNAVFYYSTSFFEGVGLGDPRLGTIAVGTVNVAATVLAIWLMGAFGRRSLLLASSAGMLVSVLGVTAASVMGEHYAAGTAAHMAWSLASVAAIMGLVAFFGIGLGPIAWLMVAELFQAKVRSGAMAVAIFLNWSANFSVGLLYPSMAEAFGPYSWLPFAAVLAAAFVGVWAGVVETQDKTLEEVQEAIGHKVKNGFPPKCCGGGCDGDANGNGNGASHTVSHTSLLPPHGKAGGYGAAALAPLSAVDSTGDP